MSEMLPLIFDLTQTELSDWFSTHGEPAYRAKQVWSAIYQNLIVDVNDISTLPNSLRQKLGEKFSFQALSPIKNIQSKDKQTVKTLFKLKDDCLVEAVLMMYADRRTVCISTQSGCGLGCVFCATGQMGFSRNLSSGEIVAQVLYYARLLAEAGDRVTNVVMMGMGEPFLNYAQMMAAVACLNNADGFTLGARRMTISTVGLADKIKKFADENSQVNLAVSLHTVDDDLRSKLMPINRKYPVASVLSACHYYTKKTNRRVTFEYALINGLNDSAEDAKALAHQIKNMLCHVNLIPLNPTKKFVQQGSSTEKVEVFAQVLESNQIPVSIRLRRGIEIGAGCGQLAANQ